MSISCVGIISTDFKNIGFVASRIGQILKPGILAERARLREMYNPMHALQMAPDCSFELDPDYSWLGVRFRDKDSLRTLRVNFDCDHDYEHMVPGQKIILSMRFSGNAEHIIKKCLLGLSHLGHCYYHLDNTDKYVRLNHFINNFTEACALGFEKPSPSQLKRWADVVRYMKATENIVSYRSVLGIDYGQTQKLLSLGHDQCDKALQEIVAGVKADLMTQNDDLYQITSKDLDPFTFKAERIAEITPEQ